MMMVFSDIQRFNIVKANYQSYFQQNSIDIQPIALINNNWTLNEEILTDPLFAAFFAELFQDFDYEIRNVDPSEYIVDNSGLP